MTFPSYRQIFEIGGWSFAGTDRRDKGIQPSQLHWRVFKKTTKTAQRRFMQSFYLVALEENDFQSMFQYLCHMALTGLYVIPNQKGIQDYISSALWKGEKVKSSQLWTIVSLQIFIQNVENLYQALRTRQKYVFYSFQKLKRNWRGKC